MCGVPCWTGEFRRVWVDMYCSTDGKPDDKPYYAFTHNISNDATDRSTEQFSHYQP